MRNEASRVKADSFSHLLECATLEKGLLLDRLRNVYASAEAGARAAGGDPPRKRAGFGVQPHKPWILPQERSIKFPLPPGFAWLALV